MKDLKLEANKCLKCKNPRCQQNCPVNTSIPEVIKLYEENKLHEAGELLFNNNPLSAVTAIVCPHENQCEGNCIKGIKGEAVEFHSIERFISEQYLKELTIEKSSSKNKRIAVIGSGPAGLTASILLAKKGYDITLFESRDKIGGVLTYGIPEFRLPRSIINDIESKLIQLDVKIKPNTTVGPVITLDKLLSDGYDAIFIGTGVWNPKTLNIKGETLGHSMYAIDYLKNPQIYNLGKKVIVIGAGNVAMDSARSAKYYSSSQTHIYYRRGLEDMTASKFEIKEAMDEGIEFHLFKAPIEITTKGVKFVSTQKVTTEDGKTKLEVIPNSEEIVECDNVIIAVSQSPQSNLVSTSPDLTTKYGLIVTDSLGNTTKESVFACGDVVSGARTVVEAIAQTKIAVNTIEEYLNNK